MFSFVTVCKELDKKGIVILKLKYNCHQHYSFPATEITIIWWITEDVFSLFNRYVKLKYSGMPWKQPDKSRMSAYVIYIQLFINISELVNPAFVFFLFAAHSANS